MCSAIVLIRLYHSACTFLTGKLCNILYYSLHQQYKTSKHYKMRNFSLLFSYDDKKYVDGCILIIYTL